jgi:hypothetical protein
MEINYSWLFIAQSGCDTVEEFLEVDLSALSFEISDHVEDSGIFGLKAETLHGGLELSGVYFSSSLSIEEIECFSELLDFVFSKSWPFDFLFLAWFGCSWLSSHLSLIWYILLFSRFI